MLFQLEAYTFPMRRARNGPGAFLVSLGTVVLFAGLMVFLALPAARKMDRAEAERESLPLGTSRQKGVVRTAIIGSSLGGGLVLAGLFQLSRRPRH